ncbi:MAG: cell division protein ZipA [Halioglobus sp.]|nr:cell division protein ZipA [Halioglobus sp.]
MELTIRDWMVIVGVLLILAVLLDAFRRIRRDKSGRVTMELVDPEDLPEGRELDIALFSELPNGGARVVERGDILKVAGFAGRKPENAADAKSRPMDSDDGLVAGINAPGEAGESVDWLDGLVPEDAVQGAAEAVQETQRPLKTSLLDVCMLNVVARDPAGFRGDDILQILLACDLRFGDLNFFHRTESAGGKGAIQFSVANMMQPGVFDIDNLSDLTTPGLVFFLTLPGPDDMMQAFDYMLETARTVARNLGGDVLDESRSVLTGQAIEHSRQQIRELERRLLAKAR